MRYLFGFMCVLALGLMGCSETAGTGGSGGDGGSGGNGVACVDNVCPCTEAGIRAAIEAGGEDPYTFDCGGPQTVVTEAEIVIDNEVILDGESNLTVDGNGSHAVFAVAGEVTAQLRGFTVTGGGVYEVGLGDPGIVAGCIDNSGTLTVADTTVSDNKIGIVNGRTLTLTNSTVTDSEIWGIASNGTLTLRNSTVSGNAGEDRNGISVFRGDVTLLYATVSDNIYVEVREGEATIASTATLIDGACVTAEESVVTWTSNGYNIESLGNTCGFDQPTDQVNVSADDLKLGPLQDNGGPTMTHALLTEPVDSVARDVIPQEVCEADEVDEDQRGEERPSCAFNCDVGAFEIQDDCGI